mmetsp:Transcript_24386/g.33419  ORF Transcript_24386/g.33419 Transcript_24386/m.33419 type:complete len:290 (-) Transcript_24386:338-1207(-)
MLASQSDYGTQFWPDNGEIDILECVGYQPGVMHATIHTKAYNHVLGTQKSASTTLPDFDKVFHVHRMDWTPDYIRVFIDGVQYFEYKNSKTGWEQWPFNKKQHILMNLAIGGTWGGLQGVDDTIFPNKLQIDYIRVFAFINSTAAPSTPSTTSPSSASPSAAPTKTPTSSLSKSPTLAPTATTTVTPSTVPIADPTFAPSTRSPTRTPSSSYRQPSCRPTRKPTTVFPTVTPTTTPTTTSPTFQPTIKKPIPKPTKGPSALPTLKPTVKPTTAPKFMPSKKPTVKASLF